METKKYNEAPDGISIGEILIEVLNRKFLVIGIVVLAVVCSFFYTKFLTKPRYTACAKMLITRGVPVEQQMSTGDFSVSSYLIKDYTEIMLDKVVLERVAEELDIKLTAAQIKGKIKIQNPSESRILEIYVTTENPNDAQKIANKICTVSKEEIFSILKQETINIMSKADTPKSPSGPNMTNNLIYGFLGGLIIAVGVVVLIYVFDDTFKGKNDVRKYLGVEVLGVIPYIKPKEASDKKTVRGR